MDSTTATTHVARHCDDSPEAWLRTFIREDRPPLYVASVAATGVDPMAVTA